MNEIDSFYGIERWKGRPTKNGVRGMWQAYRRSNPMPCNDMDSGPDRSVTTAGMVIRHGFDVGDLVRKHKNQTVKRAELEKAMPKALVTPSDKDFVGAEDILKLMLCAEVVKASIWGYSEYKIVKPYKRMCGYCALNDICSERKCNPGQPIFHDP